jgi:hypothetical protein
LANEFSAEIFHAVPKGALEAAAEFFGDVFDYNKDIGHDSMPIIYVREPRLNNFWFNGVKIYPSTIFHTYSG